jgi:hypothetical protein
MEREEREMEREDREREMEREEREIGEREGRKKDVERRRRKRDGDRRRRKREEGQRLKIYDSFSLLEQFNRVAKLGACTYYQLNIFQLRDLLSRSILSYVEVFSDRRKLPLIEMELILVEIS